MATKSRRAAYVFALPCLCLIMGLFILFLEAGQTSTLMWSHHLQHLATASLSTLRNFSSYGGVLGGAAAVSPSVVDIQAGPCTCSLQLPEVLDSTLVPSQHITCSCGSSASSSSSTQQLNLVQNSSLGFNHGNLSSCINGTEKLAEPEKEKMVVKEPCPPTTSVVKNVYVEPWYVPGRHWHYPSKFPRCTMDACFNYSRCAGSNEILVYAYDQPAAPVKFFQKLNQSKYYTDDPSKACLFFVFLDTPGIYRSSLHPSKLPFWEGGLNHVLITFADKWASKGPHPESIGYASVMATVMHETLYRPGFDVSIPLPPKYRFAKLLNVKPLDRKYLLTFRGLRYLQNEGVLRSDAAFRQMHNGKDIIIVTSCRHANHKGLRKENASLDAECREDEAVHDSYNYGDLMNSTFGLAPAGRQPSTYRFGEILSAGSIPVLVVDNYVKPYDKLVQWHRCVLQFPSTEVQRIVGAVRAMKREEVERRQRYCVEAYLRYFSSGEALLQASMEAQKTRFMGAFPAWTANITRK